MTDREHRFEIWQDGIMVAEVSSSNLDDARREARHYAMIYARDGAVTVRSKKGLWPSEPENDAVRAAAQADGRAA